MHNDSRTIEIKIGCCKINNIFLIGIIILQQPISQCAQLFIQNEIPRSLWYEDMFNSW